MIVKMKKLNKAKYCGLRPEECASIIISYLTYSGYDDLIWKKQKDYLAPFEGWWNEYISDEDTYKESP